jgi:hypothetical protein
LRLSTLFFFVPTVQQWVGPLGQTRGLARLRSVPRARGGAAGALDLARGPHLATRHTRPVGPSLVSAQLCERTEQPPRSFAPARGPRLAAQHPGPCARVSLSKSPPASRVERRQCGPAGSAVTQPTAAVTAIEGYPGPTLVCLVPWRMEGGRVPPSRSPLVCSWSNTPGP